MCEVETEDVLAVTAEPNRPSATPLKNADHVSWVANGYSMEIPIDAKVYLISGPAHTAPPVLQEKAREKSRGCKGFHFIYMWKRGLTYLKNGLFSAVFRIVSKNECCVQSL
ncbi:hypothetical protein HNY73_006106 [Argiope bruennichi]|uniref:Uncharacterized protein n=1 Tax=Argiope bruennichi TaxID=94029 RepID=A0A8T0FL38_ARGBR|nr:hypothetical protein HNY73_006106 [Argiope bruennichi]